jgi:hypothetical protein
LASVATNWLAVKLLTNISGVVIFPVKVFEPVVANEPLNEPNVDHFVSFEAVYTFNELNIPTTCDEPLTIPAGIDEILA